MAEPGGRRIVHLDLAAGPPALPPDAHDGRDVQVHYWWNGVPLGQDELMPGGLPPRVLADRIAWRVAHAVSERVLPCDGRLAEHAALRSVERPLAALEHARDTTAPCRVTLAICTSSRPRDLERCLASVTASAGGWSEILVVDNAPSAQTAAVAARFSGVRYIEEPRRGLSVARNTAIAAARGDVLAFVDDDVTVHPEWLVRLRRAFARPEVMAVAGLVLPARLDTRSELVFERELGGLGRGYVPRRFGPRFYRATRRFGVPVWEIGAGANLAVRMVAFEHVGTFDERLGAGASGCSEDSEFLYRLLAAGWECVYDPDSVVFHAHRSSTTELSRQTRAYIEGHLSGLFAQYARSGDAGNLHRAFSAIPRFLLARAVRRSAGAALSRAGLRPAPAFTRPLADEMRGYVAGLRHLPIACARSGPRHKAPLRAFLARNPFPEPLTEGFFYREKMRAIHRVSPDEPLARILEVGGGQSGLARLLYPRAEITTVDRDPGYADAPVNRQPGVRFVSADATALPFADGSFDAVTFFDVLEHIEDDRDAVREALRVLRPGGWLLASSPNLRWRSPYHRAMRPICPGDDEMMARWGHVRRGYDLAAWTRLVGAPPLASADFINRLTVVCHDLSFSRLPGRLRRGLCWAVAPLTWLGYALQPTPGRGTETAVAWRVLGPAGAQVAETSPTGSGT